MTEPSRPVSPLVDSAMTSPEAVAALRLIDVRHWSFDGRLHAGQLVVHRDLAADVRAIFDWIERSRFPVAKAVPIVRYGWSDDASMADNNTSAFNYRLVEGTERLSLHALGRAVDLNPRVNPVIYGDGRISPPGAAYRPGAPGTVTPAHPLMEEFRGRGWTWGGDFEALKDYHHFEKRG